MLRKSARSTKTAPASTGSLARVPLAHVHKELPELAPALFAPPERTLLCSATAPDGEGGCTLLGGLDQPFARVLAQVYELGATSLRHAEPPPPSLRSHLAITERDTAPAASARIRTTPRSFASPLTSSVASWLEHDTSSQVRKSPRAAMPHQPASAPAARPSPGSTSPGSFPPPPLIPRFPVAPSASVAPRSGSLSPVAASSAPGRQHKASPWYVAAVSSIAVAAVAVAVVWNPGSSGTGAATRLAAQSAGLAPRTAAVAVGEALRHSGVSSPFAPAGLDARLADAVLTVGSSAASICASGAHEPRDAIVDVTLHPSGSITAHVASPINVFAASCVEQAYSRQRIAPFEGQSQTRRAVIHLNP